MTEQDFLCIDTLRAMKMFGVREALTDEELQEVLAFLQTRPQETVASGQMLIKKDKTRECMYLLLEGSLHVILEKSRPDPIAILNPGESVGEISLIDQQPSTAYVVAKTNSRVLVLNLQDLMTLGRIAPSIMINLLYMMVQRLRYGNLRISEVQEKQLLYEEKSVRDALTGLYNRSWLDQELPRSMQMCREHRQPFVLCMVDVDKFKNYNDNHGHVAGDCALRAVATTLEKQLRGSDRVARYGGEEFTVFLPMTHIDKATLVSERLRHAIEVTEIFDDNGTLLPSVTISLGFAFMQPDDSPTTIIQRADKALYRAKEEGRNRVEFL